MKALVKREAKRGLWLEDVAEPEAGPNDVKIRVKRTAICGMKIHNCSTLSIRTIRR